MINSIFHKINPTVLIIFILFCFNTSYAQINYQHFLLKGQTELQKEDYLQSIKSFNIALTAKGDGFEAFFLRGIAKFSLGDYRGASNDFTSTIKIHPLYARAYQYRGISYDRL